MPMYLKRDTIRLLEASVESISLAVAALGLPRRYESREPASENSIAIGLAGVSAELAMSAIIVQAKGEQALRFPSNFYKTGSHIVDDFRLLITSQIPKMVFLTQNVRNPADHISKILELSSKFKLLTKSRAGGLHAGKGPSRDVCIACVNNVIDFINLLGQSSRIKPYTESVPRTIDMPKSYDLIIDDLVRKLNQSSSNEDKAIAISSIYLVIPELPEEEPEWIQAFERLMVIPKETDISFLLDTLQASRYASLIKVAKSSDAIPVVVQKGNYAALPIEPQYLKKSFSDIRDRWYADRGTANGRLDQKQFDPPPIESVYEIFTFQFHVLRITDSEEAQLTAADTWPLIAASLAYAGTRGPCWYFVRKTSDWGQLEAYMNRASMVGRKLKKGFEEFKPSFEALKAGKPITKTEKYVSELLEQYPVSFKDGAKFKNKIGDHKELRKISDEICREHELSVLENSEFYSKGKKKEYWVHKAGKKTHRDYLREDVEYCLSFATSPREFENQLYALGYTLDPVRFSVKAKHWERAVRLSGIGFSKDRVNAQLRQNAENRYRLFTLEYRPPYKPKKFPLEDELRKLGFSIEHSYDTATVLVDTLFYIIITVVQIVAELADVMLLSPDLRAAEKDLKELVADYHFLQEHGIHTTADLQANIEQSKAELSTLEHERSGISNRIRRPKSPNEQAENKERRKAVSKQMKPVRERLRRAERILEKSPHLYELLKQEHELEKKARARYKERGR